MRIGLFDEPLGDAFGGAEFSVAILAEALSRDHTVEIVHTTPSLNVGALGRFAGADLSGVAARRVSGSHNGLGDSLLPWARYRQASNWLADASRPYDIFINNTHGLPPVCHAPVGMLMVLFPLFVPLHRAPAEAGLWPRARRAYSGWEWAQRAGSYQIKASNSSYTREWTRRRWGFDSHVVFPPIQSHFAEVRKDDIIISVGRFAARHSKKQREMMEAFRRASARGLNWRYESVGGLGDSPADRAYFEEVRAQGEGTCAEVTANISRDELRGRYERAKIFWHAMGYGEDDDGSPERAEHFGITTAEAMAAGCVPVVIRKGGQMEIVEHGVSGFMWDTLDELVDYTLQLARDGALRERMSAAARARSQQFSRDAHVRRCLELLVPHLS